MALNFHPIKYLKSIFERPEDDDKRKMLVAPGVVIDVPNRPVNPTTPSVGAVAREIPGAVKKTVAPLVEPLKTGSNNAKKVLKTVGNTLTSSTQKFGNTIGTSLALSGQQEMLDETARRNEELSNTTLNLIKQRRAQGKDVTNLTRQYQSITGNVPTIEELNPTINKTTGQVLGEAAGTLLEATSGSTFAKGAKSFQLANKASMAPAVISSASKAVTKKEALKQAGKSIAVGAAQGYTYDVSTNLQEGKTGAKAFKPGLGTAVGAAVPALSSAVGLARTEASLQVKDLITKGYAKDEAEKIVKEGGYLRLFESPKLRELGDKINELNSKMVNAENKTLQARYKKAYEQAVKQYKKEQQGGFVRLFEGIDEKTPVVQKERKFLDTVKQSPVVSSETKQAINELPNRFQTPITNKETLSKAQARVNQSTEGALSYVMGNDKPDEETIATGIELMRKYRAAGNTQLEADIAGNVAEKLTKAGRTVQAASIFNRLSPDGVLVYAQRQIQKANKNKLFGKDKVLDNKTAEVLKGLAKKAEETTDLIPKEELQNELRSALSSLTTAGLGKRVATAQTIAQLFNPKTMIRNTIGNEIFWRLERANKYLATPIDIVRSKLTGGPRTITFRTGADWNEFFNPTKDYLTGLKKGAKAGLEGRSLTPTQSDFNPGLTFTSKWNPVSWFERSMKATLGGFDQAAFNRARNQTIGELSYLKALNEGLKGKAAKEAAKKYAKNIDQNVLDLANEYGKYVTYQDDNILSTGLGKVKRALNLGKDFGAGDLIIKYPKTPGAIMMRAIEYSPAGILKSAYELGKAYKNGTPGAEKATLALSRAITGTLGLTGMGYVLADKGIIIGKPEEDKDIKATRKETGVTKYQVNLSALERFVKSNFKDSGGTKPGDKLYSYDWVQPIAVSLSMGANANKNVKAGKRVSGGLASTVSNSITGGVETLTEQPVISGVNRIFQGQGVADTAIDTAKQLPSSFVPTALSQVNQYQDNTSRTTYDPSPVQEAWNRAKAKIPGVSKSLPEQKTILGETAKRYEDNTFFNVFTNPAFENTYKERPEIKMVLDIYERSGETKQAPRVVGKTAEVTKDGKSETVKLTPKEQQALQATIGALTQDVFYKLSAGEQKDRFAALPDEKKAEVMADILSDISQAARIQVLGHRPSPKGVSDRARKYSRELKADPDLQQYLFTRTP